MAWSSLALITLLAGAALAGPAGLRSTCVESCTGGSNFLYKTGFRYDYMYDVDTISKTPFDLSANLKASALVSIQAVTPCEFTLSIKDAKLIGSSSSDEFATAVEKNELRFSFQNGIIDHLCGSDDEVVWVLNFKRGILSHFQNGLTEFEESQQKIQETDINGNCQTKYKIEKDDDSSFFIKKDKILTECEGGSNLKATLFSLGFERDYSDINKGVQADSSCTQKINGGTYEEIRCTQYFKWNGVHVIHEVEATSSLKFKGASQNIPKFLDFYPVRSNLLFEEVKKKADVSVVEDILFTMKGSTETIQKDTPRLFFDLVKALDGLTFEELEKLDTKTKEDDTNKFFHDALLLTSSPEAMKAVVHKGLSGTDMDIWFTSLSFVKNPTLKMLSALTPLILNNPEQKASLAISSMINNYCSFDTECHLKSEIQVILRSMESYLGTNCYSDSEDDKSNILIALKSLGNAGRYIDAEYVLQRCYSGSNAMEVRISAIEAYRKTPCDYNRDHLLTTYKDQTQDTEVRIAAYLAVMKCPTQILIDTIKDRLTYEDVNQVSSFVWSHLTNLQESAAPEKRWIRELIGEDQLQNKFNSEALKFSRYYESSFFMKELNVGGNAEADVIFSPESYLPRSAMLNLTVDVFGVPVNLLEIGGRMKGFESMIEMFFGPNGYYPDTTIQAMLKNMRESKTGVPTTGDSDPEGSLFIKLFGNELFYKHFHGHQSLMNILGFSGPTNLWDIFRMAGGRHDLNKFDLTKNFNFIDKTVTFPSIIGFPVNLKLKSSATLSLQLEGGMELMGLTWFEISGKIRPSASVITDSSMEVDAFVTTAATTTKTTTYTSSYLGGRAIVRDLQVIDFKLDLPKDNVQELYSKTHKYYIVQDGVEQEYTSAIAYHGGGCRSMLFPGSVFCTVYEQFGSYLPTSTSVYLENQNQFAAIEFRASFQHREGNYLLFFDLPGGPIDVSHKHMASLSLDKNAYRFQIDTPYIKVKSDGKKVDYESGEEVGIKLDGDVMVNDHIYYSLFYDGKRSQRPFGYLAQKFILKDSRREVFHFEGEYNNQMSPKVYLHVSTDSQLLGKNSIILSAKKTQEIPTIQFAMNTEGINIDTSGSLILQQDSIEILSEGHFFIFPHSKPITLDSSIRFSKQVNKNNKMFSGAISFNEIGFSADWKTSLEHTGFTNKGNLEYFGKSWSHDSHVHLSTIGKTNKLDLNFVLHCPQRGFTLLVKKNSEISDQHMKQNSEFQYGDIKGSSSADLQYWKSLDVNMDVSEGQKEVYSLVFNGGKRPDGSWRFMSDLMNTKIDLYFHDKSIKDQTFDYTLNGEVISTFLGMQSGGRLASSLKASKTMLDLEASYTNSYTNKNSIVIIKGSHSEFAFTTNIYRPMSVIGKFVPNNQGRGFEFRGSLDDKEVIRAVATLKGKSVEASLKYNDIDVAFLFALSNSGMETKFKWASTKEISVNYHYELGDDNSILVSTHTPFPGWEKQELNLSFGSTSLRDIHGQLGLTWANINHFTLTFNNKLKASLGNHKYTGLARITSSLKQLEITSLEINHEIADNQINSNVEFKLNDAKVSSEFKAQKTQNNYEASYFFKYPNKDISVESTLALTATKGSLSLNADVRGTILPEIKVKGSYDRKDDFVDANFVGKVGSESLSVLLNTRKDVDEGTYKTSFQFTSPFTNTFEINYNHKLSQDQTLEADFTMTSLRYPGENYKVHLLGNIFNLKNMYASGYINGPNLAGKVKINNHYSNGKFKTNIDANMNQHEFILNTDANYDEADRTGNFNLQTKSSFAILNGIKMRFDHGIDLNGRKTRLFFDLDDFHFEGNAFYEDYRNFEFNLNVNNLYKLLVSQFYKPHERKKGMQVEVAFNFVDFKLHLNELYFKPIFEFYLNCPWVRSIEISVKPNSPDKIDYTAKVKVSPIDYLGNFAAIRDTVSASANVKYLNKNVFAYKVSDLDGDIKANLLITNFANIDFEGKYDRKGPVKGQISITGKDFELLPITVKFDGFRQFNELKAQFSIATNMNDEISFELIKTHEEFSIKSNAVLLNALTTEFDIQYKTYSPFKASIVIKNSSDYKLIMKLDEKEFSLDGSIPEKQINGKVSWIAEPYRRAYEVVGHFTDKAEKTTYNLKYDRDSYERTIELVLKKNDIGFSILAKAEKGSRVINLETPWSDFKHIDAIIKYEYLIMDIEILKNSDKFIHIIGKGVHDLNKCSGELNIFEALTPYETHKIKIDYIKSPEEKGVNLQVKFGEFNIKSESFVKFVNNVPEILFKFYSPSLVGKSINFEIDFSETTTSKALNVHGLLGTKQFQWTFKLQPSNIDFKIKSKNLGWDSYELKCTCEKKGPSMKASVNVIADGDEKIYSFSLINGKQNFKLEIETPIPAYSRIHIDGDYNTVNNIHKVSANVKADNIDYKLHGEIMPDMYLPEIKFLLTNKHDEHIVDLHLKIELSAGQKIEFSLKSFDTQYKFNIYVHVRSNVGAVESSFVLPFVDWATLSVNGKYDLENGVSTDLEIIKNKVRKHFAAKGKIEPGSYKIEVETPFKGLEEFTLQGKYWPHYHNSYYFNTMATYNSRSYQIDGELVVKGDGYSFETTVPYKMEDELLINGFINRNGLELEISSKNNLMNTHKINLEAYTGPISSYIKLETTFESVKKLFISGKNEFLNDGTLLGGVNVELNDQILILGGKLKYSMYDSLFEFSADTSNPDKEYFFKSYYNFMNNEKSMGIIFESPSVSKQVTITSNYKKENPYKASVTVTTSVLDYKKFGLSYDFALNSHENKYNAYIKVIKNENEFSFGAVGEFGDKHFITKLVTPFENYKIIELECGLDLPKHNGKFVFSVGDWIYKIDVNIDYNNAHIELLIPYSKHTKIHFMAIYDFSSVHKFINLKYQIGDTLYNAFLKLPTYSNTLFNFKIQTPLPRFSNLELIGGFEFYGTNKFIKLGYSFNEEKYFFISDLHWSGCEGDLSIKVDAPRYLGVMLLNGSITLGKHLSISFERNGQKDILLQGRYSDKEISFGFEAPSLIMNSFKSNGTYNRAKRSVELFMMNDHHHGEIISNFNSLKVKLKTPFDRVKELEWEVSRPTGGGFVFNYKRNDHYIHYSRVENKDKTGFDVSLEGALPGWEILAVTGRLTRDEMLGYLSGQLKEDQMTISGSGSFEEKGGTYNLKITTPFAGYEEVKFDGKYDIRKRIYSLRGKAKGNNNFKFMIESKRAQLSVDIFVPHPQRPTEVKGRMSLYKGKLNVNSRFAFIKTYSLSYELKPARTVTAYFKISRNGVERFNFDFMMDTKMKKAHFHLMIYLLGNKSTWHYQREGFSSIEVSYTRNDNVLKLEATGSGNLPNKGKIEYSILNTFPVRDRKHQGDIEVDRTGSPKKLKINIMPSFGGFYTIFLDYNIDLDNLNKGDYKLRINTVDKKAAPWKSISGNWEVDDDGQGMSQISVGPFNVKASGKFGLLHSDLTFDHNLPKLEQMYLGWKFSKKGNARDYYLKVGRKSRYVMIKFKGTIDGMKFGDIAAEFRASKYMDHDLNYTFKWKEDAGSVSGGGTFKYGGYAGKETLHFFRRKAAERAAEFKWDSETNIPDFTKIELEGEYSLKDRMVDITLNTEGHTFFSIKGKLDDFTPQKSKNTLSAHLPGYGDGSLTIRHDFTDPLLRKASAEGLLNGKKVSYKYERKSNADFTVSKIKANADSAIFGKIKLRASYDISDFKNAQAMLKYNRNKDKFIDINWSRKLTDDSLDNEFTLKSSSEILPKFKAYINANWESGISYVHGIECHDHVTKLTFEAGPKKAELSFTSPFPILEDISAVANYDFKSKKTKTLNVKYQRGKVLITLDVTLKMDKKKGSFVLDFASPYKIAKVFHIDAQWNKGKLDAQYKRNNIEMPITAKADVKQGKASFDISFTPPGKSQVNLKLDLDTVSYNGASAQSEIVNADFSFAGQQITIDVKGYKNDDKINVEITGSSSFKKFKKFHALLDSELNLADREGHLMVHVDDFEFDMRNALTQNKDGFYFESHVSTTLTPLPSVKVGFGKEMDTHTLTFGIGDVKEMTITFNAKDNFRKGIKGKIDLPHRNIKNVDFDIGYSFDGEDKLEFDLTVDLGGGKKIEAQLVYDSTGVKSRLSSPFTGDHSFRFRRSILNDQYPINAEYKDCYFSLRNLLSRGYMVEGTLLGNYFKADLYLDRFVEEGRFLFSTSIEGFENFGIKFNNRGMRSLFFDSEILLPYRKNPIHFSIFGNDIRGHILDISVSLDGLYGSHKLDLSILRDKYSSNHIVNIIVKPLSQFLPNEFKIRVNKKRPYKLLEIYSDEFNFTFNYDIQSESNFKPPYSFEGGSSLVFKGETLYDFHLQVNSEKEVNLNIDSNFLKGTYKLSSNVNYSFLSQEGKGYFIASKNSDSMIRFIAEIHKDNAITEFTVKENHQSHDFKLNYKFIKNGKEISVQFVSPIFPKISFAYTRMPSKPFMINFDYEFDQKTYLVSIATDIQFTQNFFTQENAFFKSELQIPGVPNPYSFDLKYYNQHKIKGIKAEISDGQQVHLLSGKLSMENYSGKLFLSMESPLLQTTSKAYFNLAYSFEKNFSLHVEIMEGVNVAHSLYLEFNPKEKHLFANTVSPFVYSGVLKLEARIGEFSENYGDAQVTITTAIDKISANLKGEMLPNKIECFVNINTPFKGLELIKFGGEYSKGDLTKVVLFAEPYNFKASGHFGQIDSTIKFGMEANTNLDLWQDSTLDVSIPLDRFNPHITLDFGSKNFDIDLYYDRISVNRGIGWNISTPWSEATYEVYYRVKAPYELGFKAPSIGNYHVMFDSSFLIFSKAAVFLI